MKTAKSYSGDTMKGHMALNSSPFKPSINKLSSQFLIQDQMMSHYYNLATMKSAIDSAPPKSTSLSIKKRDQVKRAALLKSINGETSPRTKTPNKPKHAFGVTSDTTIHDYHVSESRPTSARSWTFGRKENFDKHSRISKPTTSSGFSSYKRHTGTTRKLSPRGPQNSAKMDILELTYSGDYLVKHEERFRNDNNAPFTPRTKKRPGKSFLSQSKHYAPPPQSSRSQKSEKKNIVLKSHDGVTKRNIKKLDGDTDSDSRSSDHQRWIEEQSVFVRRLSLIEQEERERSTKRASPRSSSLKSTTRCKIEEEEEELKYLEFVNEVTNDVLSRGIYLDSVLNQVMERHVERRRHDLEVPKMWNILRKLKVDLGMTNRSKYESHVTDKNKLSDHDLERQSITRATGRLSASSWHSSSRSYSVLNDHTEPKLVDYLHDKDNRIAKAQSEKASSILDSHHSDTGLTEVDNVVKTPSLVSVSTIVSVENKTEIDKTTRHSASVTPRSKENEVTNLKPILKSSSKESFTVKPLHDITKPPSPGLENTTTEEESDYESVVALSTVLKPTDDIEEARPGTPLLSESRTVVIDQTDSSRLLPHDLEETLKVDEEDKDGNYSEDFNEDSDDDDDDDDNF